MTFPLETLPPPGDPIGRVVYLRKILSPEEVSHVYDISVFGKRLPRKSDNVVVFPFDFYILVQQQNRRNITATRLEHGTQGP